MIEVIRQYLMDIHPEEEDYYLGGDRTRLPENGVLIVDTNSLEREELVYPSNVRVCFYHDPRNNLPQGVADVFERAWQLLEKIRTEYHFEPVHFTGQNGGTNFGNRRYVINWIKPYAPHLSTCNTEQLVLDVDLNVRYSSWDQRANTWREYDAFATFSNPGDNQSVAI